MRGTFGYESTIGASSVAAASPRRLRTGRRCAVEACGAISTTQPSRSWMMRVPYAAFTSECVTWMIVAPLLVQRAEQLHDLLALRRVQVAGRLVGEDHLRVRDHRARDADQLLLAARELVRIEILLADDLEAVEDVADHALALLPADVAVRERNLEVLVDRQVVEQVIALEDEADVLLVQLRALLCRSSRWTGWSMK